MESDQPEKSFCALSYARSLNFTDAQYEEAIKRVDPPVGPNQLLVALIDVSSQCEFIASNQTSSNNHDRLTTKEDPPTRLGQSVQGQADRESTSSCYSSITSFASSSDQSLSCIQQAPSAFGPRKIFIDGPNVARTHGKDASFSWAGICNCVDWFRNRKHCVKVLVPAHRCQQLDEATLTHLNDCLVQTPVGCNDDLFIIEAAMQNNGVIVSNDLYRDEKRFNQELERFIHLNRLPYIFVDDLFIPAQDPRGRSSLSLDEFLNDSADIQYGCHKSNTTHKKVASVKSQQRYNQRTGGHYIRSNQNAHNTYGHFHSSSPMELAPYFNSNHEFIQHSAGKTTYHNRQQTSGQNRHHSPSVRRAISNSYTTDPHNHSGTRDSSEDGQRIVGQRSRLFINKSHNV